jgi:GrpB-like predicted nucleotidyltransferase (UPF0157 family)
VRRVAGRIAGPTARTDIGLSTTTTRRRPYLDLRDRLRGSEVARPRYTAVKQAIIATGMTDMSVYSDAKSGVIASIRAEDL